MVIINIPFYLTGAPAGQETSSSGPDPPFLKPKLSGEAEISYVKKKKPFASGGVRRPPPRGHPSPLLYKLQHILPRNGLLGG